MNTRRDWADIAKVFGVEVTGRELDRITGPLRALDDIVRPLAFGLRPGDQPAICFHAHPEGDE